MSDKTALEVITSDGSRWEAKYARWAQDFVWARQFGSEGAFCWKIYLQHIVAAKLKED